MRPTFSVESPWSAVMSKATRRARQLVVVGLLEQLPDPVVAGVARPEARAEKFPRAAGRGPRARREVTDQLREVRLA